MVKVTGNIRIKYKIVIVILMATSAAVVIGLYLLDGISKTVSKSRTRIAEMNRDLVLIDKTLADKARYEADIVKVKNTIPSQYFEVSYFTTQVERIAINNNLTLVLNIDQKKKEEKAPYASIAFSLETDGNYSQIAEFFSQLSKLPYHTSVDYLKMSKDDGTLKTEAKFKLFVEK